MTAVPSSNPVPAVPSPTAVTQTPGGECHAPWLVYCDRMYRFQYRPNVLEWLGLLLVVGVMYSVGVSIGIRSDWQSGVLFSIIPTSLFVGLLIYMDIGGRGRRRARHLASRPAISLAECARTSVVLATARRNGGDPGQWLVDPHEWRQDCMRFLAEGQNPPNVISVDVRIPGDCLGVDDVYEEADVGAGRRLTPDAAKSLKQRLLLMLLGVAACGLVIRYTALPLSLILYPLGAFVGYAIRAFFRLNAMGDGLTSAIASPRRLSVVRFGKEIVFTPSDSVLVVQDARCENEDHAERRASSDAKVPIKVIACREDGKTASLVFDDRRDAGMADLLARWNAPVRADALPTR